MKHETIYKFHHLGTARAFVDRAIKLWQIVLGDDEMFWVVTPAHAARLERAGYEVL